MTVTQRQAQRLLDAYQQGAKREDLLIAQRDAMRTLLERLLADEVAHPKRAIRTWLDRCDDWAEGRVPVGENLP